MSIGKLIQISSPQFISKSASPLTSTNLDRPDSENQCDENVDTIIEIADTAHQIQGFWPMTTRYRKKLVAVIALSFLSFTSPLLLIRSAGAESVSAPKPK